MTALTLVTKTSNYLPKMKSEVCSSAADAFWTTNNAKIMLMRILN